MTRRLAATVLLLLGASLALGVQKPDDGIKYTSPEGRYTVSLPAQPKLTTQESATTPEGLKSTQYLASVNDGTRYYLVAYFDLPSGVTFSFDKARDGMLKAVNGTLVSEGPISLDASPGRELKAFVTAPDGVDYLVSARVYNVDTRIYILQFIRPKSSDESVMAVSAAKFFDSFQVVKN